MRAPTRQSANRSATRGRKGFSLIELLIVVAVILTIAAIAVPSVIRSRMRANEGAAVANLRDITTAEVVYCTTYGIGFSSNLKKLGGNLILADVNNAGLIDDVLASGTRTGYIFTYKVLTTDSNVNVLDYGVNVDPVNPGVTGERHFYSDQTAVIRQNQTGSAGPSDPPIS